MRIPVLLALASLLLIPAAAAAHDPFELTAHAKGSRGYTLALDVYQAEHKAYGTVALVRTRKGQRASSTFTAGRRRFTAKGDMSSGRVRLDLGPRGHLDLRFKATGRAHKVGETSCNFDAIPGRRGVLAGTVVLHAGTRFGTIRRARLRGLMAHYDDRACAPEFTGAYTELASTTKRLSLDFNSRNDGRMRVEADGPTTKGRRWLHTDSIRTTVPDRALSVDTAAGTAQATVHGPFLDGTLTFAAFDPFVLDQYGEYSGEGRIGGSIVAHFPTAGTRRPHAGDKGFVTYSCEDECAGL